MFKKIAHTVSSEAPLTHSNDGKKPEGVDNPSDETPPIEDSSSYSDAAEKPVGVQPHREKAAPTETFPVEPDKAVESGAPPGPSSESVPKEAERGENLEIPPIEQVLTASNRPEKVNGIKAPKTVDTPQSASGADGVNQDGPSSIRSFAVQAEVKEGKESGEINNVVDRVKFA